MKYIKSVLKVSVLLVTIFFASNTWALSSSSVAKFTEDWDPVTHNGIYSIELTNTGDLMLYDFFVQTPVTPISGSDQTSEGWGTPWIGSDNIEWIADFGSALLPGVTLGGFNFIYNSDKALGSLSYYTIGWDSIAGAPGEIFPGNTVVPEPATLLFVAGGLIVLFGIRESKNILPKVF